MSRRNAHPFLFDHILGAHNGTLDYSSHHKLSGAKKFDTDSEALLYEIETKGISETLKELEGAWALVWYDSRDDTINLLRNKERSLWYVLDAEKKQLFWSSEWAHLASALTEIKLEGDKPIHLLPEDTHFSWKIPAIGQEFSEPEKVKRAGYVRPLVTGAGFGKGYYSANSNQDQDDYLYGPAHWDQDTFLYRRWNKNKLIFEFSQAEFGKFACWSELPQWMKEYKSKPRQSTNIIDATVLDTTVIDTTATNVAPPSQMDEAKGRIRDRKFEEVTKDIPKGDVKMVYSGKDSRIMYNIKDKVWIEYKFAGFTDISGWNRHIHKTCPAIVPYTRHDIEARHEWVIKGKGKNRHILYKGFKGELLVNARFTQLMQQGCLCCDRKPEWTNKVTFVNKTDFLCEYCSYDQNMVISMRQIA